MAGQAVGGLVVWGALRRVGVLHVGQGVTTFTGNDRVRKRVAVGASLNLPSAVRQVEAVLGQLGGRPGDDGVAALALLPKLPGVDARLGVTTAAGP